MREIGHFIGGKEVAGQSRRFGEVFNPNTGEVQARAALVKRSEVPVDQLMHCTAIASVISGSGTT